LYIRLKTNTFRTQTYTKNYTNEMTLSKRTIKKKSSYPFEWQLITFVKDTTTELQQPAVHTHVGRFVAMP